MFVSTATVKTDIGQAAGAGAARLYVRPRARAKQKLLDRSTIRVNARVTYTPAGGEPKTKTMKVTLSRRD